MSLGVVGGAEIAIVEAQLGGNLSINLRELSGAYLSLFLSAALALLFLILLLFFVLLLFFILL